MRSYSRVQAVARAFGFTMLELLVVIVIMGMLAAVVAPQVMNMLSGAKSDTAALQVETLLTSLNYYKIDVGTYPTAEQGLNALWEAPSGARNWRGPYVRKPEHLIDPWGNPYRYRIPGRKTPVEVYSFGEDNREGGDGENADVGTWKAR